jgi:hypothetical protein
MAVFEDTVAVLQALRLNEDILEAIITEATAVMTELDLDSGGGLLALPRISECQKNRLNPPADGPFEYQLLLDCL